MSIRRHVPWIMPNLPKYYGTFALRDAERQELLCKLGHALNPGFLGRP